MKNINKDFDKETQYIKLKSENDYLERENYKLLKKENNNLKEALKYAGHWNVIYGYGIGILLILIFGIGIYLI